MKGDTHKFRVGDKVLLNGQEVTIEGTGKNINKLPVYMIKGQWYHESELAEWYPPCPV